MLRIRQVTFAPRERDIPSRCRSPDGSRGAIDVSETHEAVIHWNFSRPTFAIHIHPHSEKENIGELNRLEARPEPYPYFAIICGERRIALSPSCHACRCHVHSFHGPRPHEPEDCANMLSLLRIRVLWYREASELRLQN